MSGASKGIEGKKQKYVFAKEYPYFVLVPIEYTAEIKTVPVYLKNW